jgi:copper chaperone CopZ
MSTLSPHPQTPSSEPRLTYLVAGMTCDHCTVAVSEEVTKVAGVAAVDVDLASKLVQVHGSDVDPAAVVAAIDEAGYDAVAEHTRHHKTHVEPTLAEQVTA